MWVTKSPELHFSFIFQCFAYYLTFQAFEVPYIFFLKNFSLIVYGFKGLVGDEAGVILGFKISRG